MWVRLEGHWHIRPNQEGLELMAPEHNIALELSDLTYRAELTAILIGGKEVPEGNQAIQETLRQLSEEGAISLKESAPVRDQPPRQAKEVVERIRRELVGTRGSVTEVYWLDPKRSRLSLSQTHLFTTKYQERTGYGEETEEAWAAGSDTD